MQAPWNLQAIATIHADMARSSDTHLLHLPLPCSEQVQIYFKDESTHITGSLKHRLARSLFLYGLCNGWIKEDTPVIEASSGSTAVSEAYFARLIGVRFIAVMAKCTSPAKIKRIEHFGGECVFVDSPEQDCATAKRLATELNGHFMDQFTYAERATDWRGNNNIAQSVFKQLELEANPIPSWIVCGAGTGGTSATFGRYNHYCGHPTQLCVVDPTHSVYYQYYQKKDPAISIHGGSGVEGIGRPNVSASFLPSIIDHMIQVPNAASYAAIHFLEKVLGKRCGGSTGTNFYGACQLAADMIKKQQSGSIVTLICDDGKLYQDTYYNDKWLQENHYDLAPYSQQFEHFYRTGQWIEKT